MVKIRRHMAPLTRTSGRGNKQKYITIHETANRGRGANANAHARLQAGVNSRQASWHYQVDDKEIVQSFDDNVKCWHAGATANNQSIAIEICVNSDGNYQKALDNAAALVAHLRKKHGIPWNRIVSHKFWTGKNCPTIMLSRKGQWDKFIAATDPKGATKVSTTTSKPKPAAKPASSSSKSVSQMADEIIAGRHGSGHANRQRSLGVNNATYQKVRDEVNRRAGVSTSSSSSSRPSKSIETMANEIIAGRHGTGHAARQRSLGVSNSVYQQVRNRVNQKASGGGSSGRGKSISQMADEIIAGKHGNGHANRQRSLGVNNATYAAVRKEVNRRS